MGKRFSGTWFQESGAGRFREVPGSFWTAVPGSSGKFREVPGKAFGEVPGRNFGMFWGSSGRTQGNRNQIGNCIRTQGSGKFRERGSGKFRESGSGNFRESGSGKFWKEVWGSSGEGVWGSCRGDFKAILERPGNKCWGALRRDSQLEPLRTNFLDG